MNKIKEIIVVEGKDDTTAIKRAVDADTIETNGSAVSKATIDRVRLAQEKRGVIILTDPDYPGQKIRQTLIKHVPGCKHAFIPKEEALHRYGKGVGVEHAHPDSIRKALKDAHLMNEEALEEITQDDLIIAGLIGGESSRKRRAILGEKLSIGYTNGKQLYKQLKMFQISKEAFIEAMMDILKDETAAKDGKR